MNRSTFERHREHSERVRRTGPCRHGRCIVARPSLILLTLAIVQAFSASISAQEAAQFFRQNCSSCHTVGGGALTGPDLKDLEKRKDREWLINFVLDPPTVLQSGDVYAAKLLEASRGVVMPRINGLTPERAEALLDLIAAESQLPKSQFGGSAFSDKPFTAADVDHGRSLFLGTTRLSAGAASCISCHSAGEMGALGGGRLGPDLTRVYERLQGRKNLSAWLQAPATPSMQTVFQSQPLAAEEIHALSAFFEHTAKEGREADMRGPLAFLLFGVGGAVAALIAMDAAWRGRLKSVRRALVRDQSQRGE
jgi:ubiquinol-cytochrome c reductase cytochrome c subunit